MVKTLLDKLPPKMKQSIEQKLALYTPIGKNGGLPHALLRTTPARIVEVWIKAHGVEIATAAAKYELLPTHAKIFKNLVSKLTYARYINTNESIRCFTEPILDFTRSALQSSSVSPCKLLLAMLPDQAVKVNKDGTVVALFGHSRTASEMAVGMRVTIEACENGLEVTKLQLAQTVLSEAKAPPNCAQKALDAAGPAGAFEAQSKASVSTCAPPGPPGPPGPSAALNGLPAAGPAVLVPPRLRRQNGFDRGPPPVRRLTSSARLPANGVENAAQLLMQLSVGTQSVSRL